MLSLLTGNPAKYASLADLLAQLEITLRVPEFELHECQDEDFLAVLRHKARMAGEALGGPCLVDDSGLLLDAYPGFPGPLTRSVCRLLGAEGLQRLLAGTTDRARLVCHLGCWLRGELWHWQGEVAGRVDPRRPAGAGPGPLSQWFVPDEPGADAVYEHRRRALQALGRDLAKLRQALGHDPAAAPGCGEKGDSPHLCGAPEGRAPTAGWSRQMGTVPFFPAGCVFCQEFAGHASSIYHQLLGHELPSRIVYATPHFLVFPPLGQFIEGGLLLVTREHVLSMACLSDGCYDELERLMEETSAVLLERYGRRGVFFEHAPLAPGDKGTCCVDHAHLNVFPVDVDVHRHLEKFPHAPLGRMRELAEAGSRNQGYLFLQTAQGNRFVYDVGIAPSQYVRQIITSQLGQPERWHWREYLGLEELKRTVAALSGWKGCPAAVR